MSDSKVTPSDILTKYSELTTKLNWRTQDIGIILRCKLLRGFYDSKKRTSVIDEDSLIELMEFANKNLDEQKAKI